MRKPPNLVKKADTFPVKFQTTSQTLNLFANLEGNSNLPLAGTQISSQTLDLKVGLDDGDSIIQTELATNSQQLDLGVDLDQNSNFFLTNLQNVQQVASIQPDWCQTDDSKPDFIKNKHVAEQLRPIFVNGQEFLDENRESGKVDIVAGKDIVLLTEGDKLIIANNSPPYSLPAATADRLGGVKSAKDLDNKVAVNKVYIDEATNIGEVRAVSTDTFVQGTEELVLNGGNSYVTSK